jgi:uncharacterized RDD family membrane protein YckC
MNKATFLQRLLAYPIDTIVLVIVSGLIGAILLDFSVTVGQTTGGLEEPLAGISAVLVSLIYFILIFVLPFCYFGYLWSNKRQSIGMGLMNIQIVHKNSSNLSFLTAGLRGTIGYYISSLVFYLGFLWALFDSQHETWHDKIFGTQVLQK